MTVASIYATRQKVMGRAKQQCSPPYPQAPPFFTGTRIHVHISRKQHQSLKFARGARSQDDEQVYVVIHPVNICIEQMVGKLIVVFDFFE